MLVRHVMIPLCCAVLLAGCATLSQQAPDRPDPRGNVLLRYAGPGADVCLTGDFNQWRTRDICAKAGEGPVRFRLDLAPGTYAYLFLADGEPRPDPEALLSVDDGFGGTNSLLVVE